MSAHLSSDVYFGNLPDAEREALDEEARLIAEPPPLHPGQANLRHAPGEAPTHRWEDVSD